MNKLRTFRDVYLAIARHYGLDSTGPVFLTDFEFGEMPVGQTLEEVAKSLGQDLDKEVFDPDHPFERKGSFVLLPDRKVGCATVNINGEVESDEPISY